MRDGLGPRDGSGKLSITENKELVRNFVETVLNGRDLGAVDQFLAEKFECPPDGPDRLDRSGFTDVLRYYFSAFSDLNYRIADLVGEGDTVVTRLVMRGTQDGEYGGRPASELAFEVEEADFWAIADGQIASLRISWDEFGMQRQLNPEVSPS